MTGIFLQEDLGRGSSSEGLVGPLVIVVLLPEPELVALLPGGAEPLAAEEFVVVGAVAALDESVLPRGGFADEPVDEAGLPGLLLKGGRPLGRAVCLMVELMALSVITRKNGGSRPRALPGTPPEPRRWISEYFAGTHVDH